MGNLKTLRLLDCALIGINMVITLNMIYTHYYMSSRPVLHFYQVSSKYSEGYWCYRADMKSNSKTRRVDNFKCKKARDVIFALNMSSLSVLHFYQVS